MNPRPDSTIPLNNRLLAALPRDEYESLLPKLELVRFPRNRILYEAGDAIHYAYFPSSGMASLLAITEDGCTQADRLLNSLLGEKFKDRC